MVASGGPCATTSFTTTSSWESLRDSLPANDHVRRHVWRRPPPISTAGTAIIPSVACFENSTRLTSVPGTSTSNGPPLTPSRITAMRAHWPLPLSAPIQHTASEALPSREQTARCNGAPPHVPAKSLWLQSDGDQHTHVLSSALLGPRLVSGFPIEYLL